MRRNDYVMSKKRYKRVRLKFFLILLCFTAMIVWRGMEDKKERKQKNPELAYGNEESTENDFVYLEESPEIRVILKGNHYDSLFHEKVEIAFPKGGYLLLCEGNHWEKTKIEPGSNICVGRGEQADYILEEDMLMAVMAGNEEDTIVISSIGRNRERSEYRGRLELSLQEEGVMVINSLPLETYLYSVVPSEMPAGYEMEALKAQAILARTYAYKYLIHPAYEEYGAHVDDSIHFQVYGNIAESERSTAAVKDTAGILLFHGQKLAEAYYYSTSCGFGSDGTVWGGAGTEYLEAKRIGAGMLQTEDGSKVGQDAENYYLELLKEEQRFQEMIQNPIIQGYEKEEPWYRWKAEHIMLDETIMLQKLKERYQENPHVILTQNKKGEFVSEPVKKLGKIKEIHIVERKRGGICEAVLIRGEEKSYKILLEYNIRYVLNGNGTTVVRQDGSEYLCSTLLPSAFFYLDTVHLDENVISYSIYGGGYGHGVGMSQNGANQMAVTGMKCEEILQFFFPATRLISYK